MMTACCTINCQFVVTFFYRICHQVLLYVLLSLSRRQPWREGGGYGAIGVVIIPTLLECARALGSMSFMYVQTGELNYYYYYY